MHRSARCFISSMSTGLLTSKLGRRVDFKWENLLLNVFADFAFMLTKEMVGRDFVITNDHTTALLNMILLLIKLNNYCN